MAFDKYRHYFDIDPDYFPAVNEAVINNNPYFCLADCKNELDVKCKVLEWFSRPACKTQYYKTTKRNEEYHKYMLDGINRFLETDFSFEDMELIYEKLGNAVNHNLTLKFIESGYDLDVLMRQEEKE